MGILSRTQCTELDNGVRLCYFYRPGVPVEIQVHIASGSMHEGKFLGCGLSHFLEHMAFQGCAGFPERTIADLVNQFGGDLNAYTGYDRTCYRMQLPREYWRKALEMLSAMVRFPELPEERFAAEREVILRECERGMDNPERQLHEKFMRTMFLEHPLRYPVIGFRDMISGVTREMAVEYHRNRYMPHRCVVVAVGDLSAGEFFAESAERFGDWQRGNLVPDLFPDEEPPASMRKAQLIYPDPLERVCCGVRAPGFGAAELPALELLFGVLGTGDTSYLNKELIFDRQLGVSVRSFCYTLGKVSVAGICGKTAPGKMGRFQSALAGELEKVAAGKISPEHLEREKGQQFADHLRELRDPVNIAGEIAGGMLYDNAPDAGDSYLKNLQLSGIDEVKKVAEQYLNTTHWVWVEQKRKSVPVRISAAAGTTALEKFHNQRGVPVIFAPDHQLPLCNGFIVMPGGAFFEPASARGISQIVAASLFSGAGKYSENRLLEKLDACGVEWEVSGGANSITVEFSAPANKMNRAVRLIASVLSEPHFENRAVEREIARYLEVLKERANSPVKAAFDQASRLMYGTHPYAWARNGRAEDIAGLTGEKVAGFYHRCRKQANCVIGFGGDCRRSEVEKWSELFDLGGGKCECLSGPERVIFPENLQHSELILDREQTVVLRMIPGIASAENGELELLEILHQAENGLAAQLFKKVREEHALSYSVGMSFSAGFHDGVIGFYAMTAPGAENKVLELLNGEISRLGGRGLSAGEFEAAKKGVLFDLDRCFEAPETLLRTAVMDGYYGREPGELTGRRKQIEALTLEEFNFCIRKYFSAPSGVEVLVQNKKQMKNSAGSCSMAD
ncbi:MAG: insulinase family protein [Lentisphaeria bacterium]|nr:insulinase family protein [Lentisphaeria bacterium]